jgi:MFS family permease
MLIGSRDVRQGTSPLQSLNALDWLNFFLAALLTGFGAFVAVNLADRGWAPGQIGLVLTVGGLAGLLTQAPAGEFVDQAKSKRMLMAAGIAAGTLGLLIYALRSDFPSVFVAAVIQGTAGSVTGPAIAAISLGLVGPDALGERLGRNQRFASIGGLTAAAVLGGIGYLLSPRVIFLVGAAFAIPVLLALTRIRAADIDYGRSCAACDEPGQPLPPRASRMVLLKDRRLLVFATCLLLFQLANASLLPLLGERLAHLEGQWSSLLTSALILVPQIFVALLAPLVGRTAGTWGRKPLLLIGLAVVPIRSGLFAVTADPTLIIVIQALDGLSGATLGVLTALVIADLTKGTGRYNLAQGLVGTVSGVGASLSTSVSGLIVARFGDMAGFLSVTAVGLIGVAILFLFMPETKPPVARSTVGSVDPNSVAFDELAEGTAATLPRGLTAITDK